MIVVVAIQPKAIPGRRYRFSPQIEQSVFIFWQNMIYCYKKDLFSTAFELHFKEIFGKGKTG
jgi:hypothetical protein